MLASPAGGGTTNPAVGAKIVKKGEVFVITALAADGHHFVNWTATANAVIANTGSASSTATLSGDATITANFAANINLTMAVSGNGTTNPAVGAYAVDTATPIPITATPDADNRFVNWTVLGAGVIADPNSASTTVTLTGDATVTANFAKSNSITLTSPVGGEKWQAGTAQVITWASVGIEGSVMIELYKSGKLDTVITTETTNDGSYSWPIPEMQNGGLSQAQPRSSLARPSKYVVPSATASGSDLMPNWGSAFPGMPLSDRVAYLRDITAGSFYKIRVTSLVNPDIYGESANYFSITGSSAYIEVTSPVAGEAWQFTTQYDVTWTSSGITGNLKIELYKGGVRMAVISGDEADDGSFSWTVPETLAAGTDYTVKVSTLDGKVSASSGQFALTRSGTTATLTMAATPDAGGTVTPAVGTHTVGTNEAVMITTEAAAGFKFVCWMASSRDGKIADVNALATTVKLTVDGTVLG